MTQLDLFDTPTSEAKTEQTTVGAPAGGAIIIAFPQGRNIGRVRHVATKFLAQAEGRPRDAYWRRIINNLVGQLEKAGIDQQEIEHQVADFHYAVQAELDLRTCYRGQGTGDGAA